MLKLSFRQFTVKKTLKHLEERCFAVPKLQREFVWDVKKACKLLDSIYCNMPVGAVLVWKTEKSNSHKLNTSIGALPPFDETNKSVWFILDGQQRLTVLHRIREGHAIKNAKKKMVDFNHIRFVLDKGASMRFTKLNRPDPMGYVLVADIMSTNWRGRLKRFRGKKRKLQSIEECRKSLLSYKLPYVFVESGEMEDVREAFIRINTLGTPLSTADRIFARASEIDLRNLAGAAKSEWQNGFDEMPHIAILQTLCFAYDKLELGESAINNVLRKISRGLLKGKTEHKEFDKRWRMVKTGLGLAIDYVKKQFGVLSFDFLPSTNMISTLAMFFYFNGLKQPRGGQKREIKKWFWVTALAQRYSGRGYRKSIMDDVAYFERLAKRGKLRYNFRPSVPQSRIYHTDYSVGSALTNAFFCLLALQKPRYLENGGTIPVEAVSSSYNKRQKHHIFPRRLLLANGIYANDLNKIGNICFIVAPENQSIGSKKPKDYLLMCRNKKTRRSVLRSHLIPSGDESPLWTSRVKKDYRRFVRERVAVICKAFEKQAEARIFINE